jgi:hypothetical protein
LFAGRDGILGFQDGAAVGAFDDLRHTVLLALPEADRDLQYEVTRNALF